MARAQAISPQLESGNVYLPHPAIARWVEDLIEKATAFPHGRYDDQVDAVTQALNRIRNTSAIYRIPESQITETPCSIPGDWGRAYAMVVTRDRVVAVFRAQDYSGTVHLYAEHCSPHAEPSDNARAILAHGDEIPGLIHLPDGGPGDKHRVALLYQQLGLDVQSCPLVEDAALFEYLQLLAKNKLKVFSTLGKFLEEYRIGDDQSPFILCVRALVSRLDLMKCKQGRRPWDDDDDEFGGRCKSNFPFSNGPGAWMR